MTSQWHNTKITKKPFSRYNPSLQNKVASVYRPWFVVVALLCILIGIAIIGCSAAMKSYDGDLKDELFHLWVGIPLFVTGCLALIPTITRSKPATVIFLIVAIFVMVVCSTGAVVSGLRYWMDHWQQTKRSLDNDECTRQNDVCVCGNNFPIPAKVDDCDKLKSMVNLLITLIALCSGGFIATIMGIYLSFMTVCCAPWMYTEWYEEQYDPDYSDKHRGEVRQIGTRNAAYGNGAAHY